MLSAASSTAQVYGDRNGKRANMAKRTGRRLHSLVDEEESAAPTPRGVPTAPDRKDLQPNESAKLRIRQLRRRKMYARPQAGFPALLIEILRDNELRLTRNQPCGLPRYVSCV